MRLIFFLFFSTPDYSNAKLSILRGYDYADTFHMEQLSNPVTIVPTSEPKLQACSYPVPQTSTSKSSPPSYDTAIQMPAS